jgi:hypothetical protein
MDGWQLYLGKKMIDRKSARTKRSRRVSQDELLSLLSFFMNLGLLLSLEGVFSGSWSAGESVQEGSQARRSSVLCSSAHVFILEACKGVIK